MLYAATGHTAAELIVSRADVNKANMGLTNWKGSIVRKEDVTIAKNYLDANEIDILNRIVTMFLDQAEFRIIRKQQIHIRDWETNLNKFLMDNDLPILEGSGSVSHDKAQADAENHYLRFDQNRRKQVEAEAETQYLEELRSCIQLVSTKRKKGK